MKRIILVEDDPGIQDAILTMLHRKGYEVTSYSGGREIISGTAGIPDLYLLDNQLTGVNGIDLCRFLKERDATALLPVIIISASPAVEKLAKWAGADGYLEKPFDMNELRSLVAKFIGN